MRPKAAFKRILANSLGYPGAYEEHPWGETVVKVNRKVFVFVGYGKGRLSMSTKLPRSSLAALSLPFTNPTGYGLGKSGWVSSSFEGGEDVPVGLLMEWVDESYRALAPKKLVKTLDAPQEPKKQTTRTPASKRRARKRRILLIGEEGARLDRAVAALEERGLTGAQCTTHAQVDGLKGKRDLVVLDMGRKPVAGIDLGARLVEDDQFGCQVVFVGVRDAALARRVKVGVPGEVLAYRGPPGDPGVVSALVELL